MLDKKSIRLYASAIALQQMHGKGFAQAFLEEQGVSLLTHKISSLGLQPV
jgi:hypothetical protein